MESRSTKIDENMEMKKRKLELQKQIKDTLRELRHRLSKPIVIALIGTAGVGKSSLINSIATAMSNKRWQEHATTGHYGGEALPVTAYTRRYPQCCRKEEHNNPQIPTLLDMGGLPTALNKHWEEVLNMIFCGRVPENESLIDVLDYVQTSDNICISKYSKTYEHLKVDKVVVVGSALLDAPEHLLKTVCKAARPLKGAGMRSIPIFGVMTKYDLIDEETKEDFLRREKRFKDLLGLNGAETRYLRCSTYCSGVDPGNQRIHSNIVKLDIPLLELMTQICDPVIEPVVEGQGQLQATPWKGILIVFVIIFACVLSIALKQLQEYRIQ